MLCLKRAQQTSTAKRAKRQDFFLRRFTRCPEIKYINSIFEEEALRQSICIIATDVVQLKNHSVLLKIVFGNDETIQLN